MDDCPTHGMTGKLMVCVHLINGISDEWMPLIVEGSEPDGPQKVSAYVCFNCLRSARPGPMDRMCVECIRQRLDAR